MIVAGLMSGTSLDGIDAAVVSIGRKIELLEFRTTPYPAKVRQRILAVSNATCHISEISKLNFELPHLYAKVLAPLLKKHKAALIGCHGQTIYHEGHSKLPNTLQIGDGSILAELTGIPVVSDFRTRDMAAGGQGAPMVPYFDYRMFRHPRRNRIALNLGGIANITVIPAGAKPEQVIAFDTGPANMVSDQLVSHFTNGASTFDKDGRMASQGTPNEPLLRELLKDPYYKAKPPKSVGREQYGHDFVKRILDAKLSAEDSVATAIAFTALTVVQGIRLMKIEALDVIAGGGGTRNPQLMGLLAAYLPGTRVTTTQEFGIDPDVKEAVAFALLAYETWHRRPSNIPSATGARHPAILGKVSF